MKKRILTALLATGLLAASMLLAGGAAAEGPPVGEQPYSAPHHPLYMSDLQHYGDPALQPPGICCIPGPGVALGVPMPPNMGYYGGHVQVAPKIYLVFWGWGEAGAFDHVTPGMPTSDPDGAGARMLAFVKALGGTAWAGSQTQYYQTVNGFKEHITNPRDQFAGVWYDNANNIAGKHNDADGLTGLELAQEAQRAAAHFGVTDLKNAQFVIAQPQRYSETGFEDGRRVLRVARLHAEPVLPRRAGRAGLHEHALRPQPGHELRPERRQHRLLRRAARRVHDRRRSRDRGDGHRPGRGGRDQRRQPRRLVRRHRLGERRQVRVGRLHVRRPGADR